MLLIINKKVLVAFIIKLALHRILFPVFVGVGAGMFKVPGVQISCRVIFYMFHLPAFLQE
jgi:hypothetical protein